MKSVVLLSGGLDSATCLALEVDKHGAENVAAVAFDYGQKHSIELDHAFEVAHHYGIKLQVLSIDKGMYANSTSTLLKGNGDMSHGKSYGEILSEKPGVVDTYVPFRNGLMLSQAAAFAYSVDAEYVVYGAHADDAAGGAYPDCTPEFYSAMSQAIYLGTGEKVSVKAPLIDLNKAQVVETGLRLGAPYELTRSCYEESEISCGTCATCIDRLNAFSQNLVKDPIPYKEK